MATVLFDNWNTDGVLNNPAIPTFFGLAQPTLITRVYLYFFNGGAGAQQVLSLTLVDVGTGAKFGAFLPVLSPGQGAVPNASAEFFPFVVLGPGHYQIIPTDSTGVPSTLWSQNPRSGSQGFARVEGVPVGVVIPPSGTKTPVAPPPLNQYERANWGTSAGSPQRILSLQLLSVFASSLTYLALYRITNSENSSQATVTTSKGAITLEPGTSVDVSTQEVEISSLKPAWGTYQNICCALATVAGPAAPKSGGGKSSGEGNGKTNGGHNGEEMPLD
ncbi:MAG TPA: hypothetical protein VGR72_07795 [Candidatus Acidoferrales bacterium]|nr:hypothetical protein [Candidatus Acidoferrales bacterium]